MENLDIYLKLLRDYVDAMPKVPLWKFNNEQCKYLAHKLKMVVERTFLQVVLANHYGTYSTIDIARWIEISKFMLILAKQVQSFIQGCCKDAWIEAAMTLSNHGSEYVSSIGFNLELCRVAFCSPQYATTRPILSLVEVGEINKIEAKIVKEKALVDVNILIQKLTCGLNSSPYEKKDMASYLLQRLLAFELNPTSDERSIWEVVLQQMQELFNLVTSSQQLGIGRTATVNKATWLGTHVAKKTFHGPDNPDFLTEVKILSQLCHPNITSMFCCAKNKRSSSIIMELMDGDLHRLIETRWEENSDFQPFPILEAVDIMLQIGEGVNYLHNKRIVHRDLKSMNILVKNVRDAENFDTRYMHVKVADFGLSKTKEKSTTYSNQTYNMGTNRWMPPEIIYLNTSSEEGPSRSDEIPKYPFKCDIYSFGMVCYEILTGCVPFSNISNICDIKRMVMKGKRPSLHDDCPYKLKTLIEKCWNQEPKERPTFVDICSELKYFKYLLISNCDVWKNNYYLEQNLSTSGQGSKELLNVSKWELGQTFTMHSSPVHGIAVNPSGDLVATASWGHLCHVYDVYLKKEVVVFDSHLLGLYAVKFSLVKQDLVGTVSGDQTCRLWNVNTGECLRVLEGHIDEVNGLSFKPRAHLLATTSNDATSMIWDVEKGISITTLKGHRHGVYGVCFQPSGGHLVATTSLDFTTKLWDPRSAKAVQTLRGHLKHVIGVDIDDSETYLATGSDDKTCRVWDLRMGQSIVVLQTHFGEVKRVAFSPYGKLLATTSQDTTVQLFDTTTWDCAHILRSHSDYVFDVAWSPMENFLVTASHDMTWKIWHPRVHSSYLLDM